MISAPSLDGSKNKIKIGNQCPKNTCRWHPPRMLPSAGPRISSEESASHHVEKRNKLKSLLLGDASAQRAAPGRAGKIHKSRRTEHNSPNCCNFLIREPCKNGAWKLKMLRIQRQEFKSINENCSESNVLSKFQKSENSP